MRSTVQRKRKGFLIGVLLFVCVTAAGCGKGNSENIDAGMDFISNLEYETALASFEKAIVSSENLELAYRGQGIAYMGMSQYEEAIASFEKALSHAGIFVSDLEYDINFYMSLAKYKLGDAEGAISILDGILDLKKKDQDAYYLRGSANVFQGKIEQGVADLNKAVELADYDVNLIIDVYMVLSENNCEEEGISYLTKVLADPKKNLNDYDQGRLYYHQKDYEKARDHLETARVDGKNKDKNPADIILMLGQTYEQLGDNNYASKLYDNYLEEGDENVEIYNRLGLCKLNMQDYEGALTAFQKALQIEPNDKMQNLKYNEIVAYEYLSDFTKAKVLMEAYLKQYPDDEKAKNEYEFLKTR